MAKYRICRDAYCGFEVQIKRCWWPFWMEAGINTHSSVEQAEKYAERYANISKPVKDLPELSSRSLCERIVRAAKQFAQDVWCDKTI